MLFVLGFRKKSKIYRFEIGESATNHENVDCSNVEYFLLQLERESESETCSLSRHRKNRIVVVVKH